MYVPSSDPDSIDDIDTMAICVPPDGYYYGLQQYGSRGTREVKRGEWDIVVYEVRKALSMLQSGNPNILSLLWLRPEHYIYMHPAGEMLVAARGLFAGKHVYNSFVGYAHGQLRKMTTGAHEGYMGEKRKELVERYGYDTKNAAHLVRILRTGIEYLSTGVLNVTRDDAAELLAIKRGEWPLEAVQAEAGRLFDAAYVANTSSHLPDRPDRDKINALCVALVHCVRDTPR
jgi:predicted nucleotidyltransferase